MSEGNDKKFIVSANWKMNLNHFEAIQFVQKLAFALKSETYNSVDVVIHAPFTDIRSVQTLIDGDKIPMIVGAQNTSHETSGAFTGEISPVMLQKLNCEYVIVGHSERRAMYGETDEIVNKKLRAVLANEMSPILCVGETAEEREAGQTTERVLSQLDAGLSGVSPDAIGKVVVAYEPIWAIGKGKSATAEDAQEVCAEIRRRVAERFGAEIRIQYGGSVKPAFVGEMIAQPDIDGFLVGKASLDPEEFSRIVLTVAAHAVAQVG